MDTPLPNLSAEEFDALVLKQLESPDTAVDSEASQSKEVGDALSVNLLQALAWSLELAPQVMTNLVSRALQSMDRKTVSLAGTAQAQILDNASAAMDALRTRWTKQFSTLLRIAMVYPAPAKLATLLPRVDLRICAEEAANLDAAVRELGCPANPLAPASYVQALLEQVACSDSHPELRPIMAEHLLGALSSQLAWVYLQLQAVLRDPTQREASAIGNEKSFGDYAAQAYGFNRAFADADASSDEQDSAASSQTHALAEQARSTVLQLRQYLGMPSDPGDDLAQALSGNPMQVLMQDLERAEQLMVLIQERGLPMPVIKDALDAALAQSAVQSEIASEAKIAQLLKNYQNTASPSLQRIPVQLREMLETLKAPLFLMAQEDERLLPDSEHPARQFLDLICQRSLLYSSEVADGFSTFIEPVDKLIGAIGKMPYVNARVFEKASEKLRTYWQRLDEKAARKQALETQQQEQMQVIKQLAVRISFELVGRKDAGDAPPNIKQFLMGPWAQVLAKAQLFAQHSDDHRRYTQAIAALLWSISVRRSAPRKPEHLILVGQLMPLLHAGLQSINMPEDQAESLLADISQLHLAVQASSVSATAELPTGDPAPPLI